MKYVVIVEASYMRIVDMRFFVDERKARDFFAESLAQYPRYKVSFEKQNQPNYG